MAYSWLLHSGNILSISMKYSILISKLLNHKFPCTFLQIIYHLLLVLKKLIHWVTPRSYWRDGIYNNNCLSFDLCSFLKSNISLVPYLKTFIIFVAMPRLRWCSDTQTPFTPHFTGKVSGIRTGLGVRFDSNLKAHSCGSATRMPIIELSLEYMKNWKYNLISGKWL